MNEYKIHFLYRKQLTKAKPKWKTIIALCEGNLVCQLNSVILRMSERGEKKKLLYGLFA